MSKKHKRMLTRILAASALFIAAMVGPLTDWMRLLLYIPAYLIVGGGVLKKAGKNILHGQVFDENFLMCLATLGAFAVGEYPEGVMVMVLYQVGELFESYAVGRSRQSISDLMDIRPDYANVERDGELIRVDPEEVAVGDLIVVKAGERIPLDGVVVEGRALADTSALTGESVPRELGVGSDALSGCINLNGTLTIKVSREFGESTAAKILELVENAGNRKAKTENFVTRFARYYTPCVVIAAALLAILPPLFIEGALLSDWVHRALTFLVISCPCALVISVPLGFFGGIGGASGCGVLVKGSNYLEALARAEIVVFDKTGTLTKGAFEMTEIHPQGMDSEELLEIAALVESYSDHPISLSLRRAYGREPDLGRVTNATEAAGGGVTAAVDGRVVLAGNAHLIRQNGIELSEREIAGTVVHVVVSGEYAGYIVITDEVKEDAARAVTDLKRVNRVRRTAMLTGDSDAVARRVGGQLGIDMVYSQLMPGDKVSRVEELLERKTAKGTLVFVGDGINDAPVLARADIGVAMGGLGSDAAIEAADVVLMNDRPSGLVTAISIARRTMRIVKQNIVFALGIKAFFLLLGMLGAASMWEAVFADVGVSVIAIINSMRALRVEKYRERPSAEVSLRMIEQAETDGAHAS